MSGPQVYFTIPAFNFWPDDLPHTLPPPVKERSFRAPFGIDPWLFNAALKWQIPFTFAGLYVLAVFILNAYNRRRNHKPWWIARHSFFPWFVVVHNAILTIYSAATFLAMVRAIVHTWPGLDTRNGLAGAADSLCKIHGPRGIGDAATYNTTINIWEVKNTIVQLGYDGNPDPTDVGRLWNEGLAFWGWVFYVSKFYEVLDTLIILAKGKRSATLQTYHHSGAMLCMWAGIRYMSPPIWMFVFVNSFIHALMYTYFTLSALGVKVPSILKRTLTSMQIAQFVWGASYAAAHLFIQYDIPIATPYQVVSTVQSAVSGVSSAASSAASAASSAASNVIESPAASGTLVALVKKLLLRAVGEEGIAERVTNDYGQYVSPQINQKMQHFNDQLHDKAHQAQQKAHQIFETRWRTDWTKTNCIDTTGEAFAIYLNLFYLAPLTFLFGRFFIKAYLGRGKPKSATHAGKQVTGSGKIASYRTSETVEKTGRKIEDEIIKAEAELQKVDVNDVHEQLRRDVAAMKNGTWGRDSRRVSDHVQNFERQVKTAAESVKEQTKRATNGAGSPGRPSSIKNGLSTTKEADDVGKKTVAQAASSRPQMSSESERKQEENLEVSESIRPGASDETGSQTVTTGSSTQQLPGMSYAEAVQEGISTSEISDFSFSQSTHSESQSQSYSSIQESQTEEAQGESVFGLKEDDSDAMGKSGAIVDYAADKAEEAREEAKEALSKATDS